MKNNNKFYRNRKGFTIMFILISVILVIYLRLLNTTESMINYMHLQRRAMENSKITTVVTEVSVFLPNQR